MTKVEKCQRGYRQVERRWRVEGSVHTALGVRSCNVAPGCKPNAWYDWPLEDLQALDHLVVSDRGYVAFSERGWI